MKKFIALLLSAMMVMALFAGCTSEPADEGNKGGDGDKGTIGVCIYKFDDAFMTTYRNTLQKILEEKVYKVSVVHGKNDQNKQNEQIDTFIT